jgi:Spy/CpxP family protein refolding chaperone
MDIFAQKKLLVRLVILLAIFNVFCIGVFLWKGNWHPDNYPPVPPMENERGDVSGVLEKELDLKPEQADKIKKLRAEFFAREEVLGETLRAERDSMNVAMFGKDTDQQLVKKLARKVAGHEYEMEMLRFEQAQQLKLVCTPEQLAKFDQLILEIRDYFRPEAPSGKPN